MKNDLGIDKNLVMVAAVGLSPAVVTETLWALASKNMLLPWSVEIYTTTQGKDACEAFIDKTRDALFAELKRLLNIDSPDFYIYFNYSVIQDKKGKELGDILNDTDNGIMADFFFEKINELKKNSNDLIISIAGGRKSMSAMLHSVASLLCSPDDKIYHILSDKIPPRSFCFPNCILEEEEEKPKVPSKKPQDSNIQLYLAEIPFPPVKEFVKNNNEIKSKSFKEYSEKLSANILKENFRIELNATNLTATFIDTKSNQRKTCDLSAKNFLVLAIFLYRRVFGGTVASESSKNLLKKTVDLNETDMSSLADLEQDIVKGHRYLMKFEKYNNKLDHNSNDGKITISMCKTDMKRPQYIPSFIYDSFMDVILPKNQRVTALDPENIKFLDFFDKAMEDDI